MKTILLRAVEAIDEQFGEGYAEKNPALVGAVILSASIDTGADALGGAAMIEDHGLMIPHGSIADGLGNIADALGCIADKMGAE